MSPNLLVITTLLFAVSALAQTQCGSYVCSSTNQCCPDDVLGSVCYDPEMAKCLPTNLPSLNDANVAGARLCGANDSTCSLTCYDPKLYYCCNLRDLKQLGQPCDAATPAPPQPATTAAPMIQNNCPGAANTAGVNCSDASLCCGAGTMTPSCLPADGSQQCCTWYLSSTQCDTEEVCGGNLGYGASSSATCGPSGTIFCNKGDGINAFCQPDELCCGNYGQYAFCCPGSNSTCPTDYSFQCVYNQATSAPTEAPTSAPTEAPVMNNCPGAANTAGVNCSDASLCCGAGTMTPSCLPADGSQQCCTWYLSSTQCDPEEVCGGNLGYGASSQASCGPSGTTFCNKGDGLNAFCEQDEICCGNYGQYAFCCPQANSTCPTDYSFECVYASSTEAPTESPTSAPTDAPTASPTEAPMEYNCPAASANFGVNCSDASLCCGAGTISPSCLPEDGSKKCCQWYLSSAQCDSDEVCGGGLGVGASSYTTCGAPGTVFCNKGTGTNTYCAPTDLCCGNQGSFAFCCPGNNSTCPTNGSYGCVYSL